MKILLGTVATINFSKILHCKRVEFRHDVFNERLDHVRTMKNRENKQIYRDWFSTYFYSNI